MRIYVHRLLNFTICSFLCRHKITAQTACGLFAIAFAYELCKGDHEALGQRRKFDTEKMRKHLVDYYYYRNFKK